MFLIKRSKRKKKPLEPMSNEERNELPEDPFLKRLKTYHLILSDNNTQKN